jgi:heat shock protein HslJ
MPSEPEPPTPRLAPVLRPTRPNPLAAGLALLFLGSVASCQAASLNLSGREFLSTGITDRGAPFALVPGTRVRLTFKDSTLGAAAGCNAFGGDYQIERGRLVVEGGSMTEMGCDEARDQQDQWLFAFLGSKPTALLAGSDLTLDNGRTIMKLVDRTIAEPDLELVGPTWTVTSIADGDAVSSIPAGATATLVFRNDGTIGVDAGCNRGSGKWAASGDGITIRDLFLTKMACADPAATLEGAVLAVLNKGAIQASIKANVLTLQGGTRGLQLTGA